MTDTTLRPADLNQALQNVATALRDLTVATGRLGVAAFWRLARYRQPLPAVMAQQQAAQLRAYADRIYPHDPRYAQDLYAAANRHELADPTH